MKQNETICWEKIDQLRERRRQTLRTGWERLARRVNNLLTRRRRIALDVLLVLIVLAVTWWACGCPMRGEAAFRRLEKLNFLAPGQIVFHQDRARGADVRDNTRLTKDIYISLGEDWAAVGYLDGRGDFDYWKSVGPNSYTLVPVEDTWMELWPLEPGPAVIPLLFPVRGSAAGEEIAMGWGAAALRLPEGTAGGELRLTDREGTEHVLAGTLQSEGTLWFWEADRIVVAEGFYPSDNRHVLGEPWMPGLDYTLELHGEAGETLAVLTGRILE